MNTLAATTSDFIVKTLTTDCLEEIVKASDRNGMGVEFLFPVQENKEGNREMYERACMYIFDMVNPRMIYHIGDRDCLWLPRYPTKHKINCIQWVESSIDSSMPTIQVIFEYLFSQRDSLFYNEPWCLNEEEKSLRKEYYDHIRAKYKTRDEYIKAVQGRLWSSYDKLEGYTGKTINRVFGDASV